MRLYHHILCLFLALPVNSALALPGQGIQARQDGDEGATAPRLASVSSQKQQPSATTSTISSADPETPHLPPAFETATTSTDTKANFSETSSASSSAATPTSSGMHLAPIRSKDAADVVQTVWTYPGHGLPLEPKVTPAIAIAGVVLIISGALYTLIGIRNPWVHVGFSAAFGAALAVTVLIEYLMNPPVTDAVQGAYFVVVVVTGLVVAGIAKLFTDITEGIGCLLGGFCIAMWFLVLKPGGLIPQKAARGVFIGCLTAVCYCLSFNKHTKLHGLIVCISFAGATITVLGIDCFSKAGLKEFWLFLWGLNENAFPLSTNTYPITRGIRVELAGIVIFSLFGIVSQMKLWKVVRERKAQKDAHRRAQDHERDRVDTEMGQKNLSELNRDKAQWELLYDDKPGDGTALQYLDSGIGSAAPSMRKATTVSLQEIGRSESDGSIKSHHIATNGRESDAQLLPSPPSHGCDEIQQIDSNGRPLTTPVPQVPSHPKQTDSTEEPQLPEVRQDDAVSKSNLPEVSEVPSVVPLPFAIPSANSSRSDAEVLSSVASVPDEVVEDSIPVDDAESLRDLAIFSDEALVIPHVDDDKASSIAATLDDLNDQVASLPPLSRAGTPFSALLQDEKETCAHDESLQDGLRLDDDTIENFKVLQAVVEDSYSIGNEDVTKTGELARQSTEPDERLEVSGSIADPITRPTAPNDTEKCESIEDRLQSGPSTFPDDEHASENEAPSQRSTNRSGNAHSAGGGSLKDHLPDNKLSKVAQAYRTNEWAKYLSLADQPELEPIPEPSSPGIKVDVGALTETPTSAGGSTPQPESRETKLARQSKDGSQASSSVKPGKTPLTARSSSDGYVPYVVRNGQTTPAPEATATLPRNSPLMHAPPKRPISTTHRSSSGSSNRYTIRSSISPAVQNLAHLRSSSSPGHNALVEQALVEHPRDEIAQAADRRHSRRPAPIPTTLPVETLLGQRKDMMRNKMHSTSFNSTATASPVVSSGSRAPSETSSIREKLSKKDPDEMSLRERKMLLDQERQSGLAQRKHTLQMQQQMLLQQQQQRPTQSRTGVHGPRAHKPHNFDSHQPVRDRGPDREKEMETWGHWRQSLHQATQPVQVVAADEGRRGAMISERNQAKMWQLKRQMDDRERETRVGERMRTVDWQNAHRDHMRRIQAAANKHVN
ncbi:uncharacterized protein J3D65DRAFT_110390 [Phyllosticta citribraziliensis]|uniref:TM7S3/TM198-like domain-containing protein n=1 Tax=Phyllosticta citribraziliensis TaxID=989973 RepID=A0ABR1L7T9_9PEZI